MGLEVQPQTLENIEEMKKISKSNIRTAVSSSSSSSGSLHSNDIHSTVFPYFAKWQTSYGKVFIYWLGTEQFLFIADPEFLKRMSTEVMGKSWGKPNVFKYDGKPMFDNGLVMVEGDDMVRHRHVITPALSPPSLMAMANLMVECTTKMLDNWAILLNSGNQEIDEEKEIVAPAGEIIAKTSYGIGYENGRQVFEKLRAMQTTLFKTDRYVGVPFSKFLCPKQTLEAKNLGQEIDAFLLKIIRDRRNGTINNGGHSENDLLGLLLRENHEDGQRGKTLTHES